MNKLKLPKSFIIAFTLTFVLIFLGGGITASANSPLSFSTTELWPNKEINEINAAIGSQANGTAILTFLGTRAPRIAQSDQYLAMVYQQGTNIRLRSTKKEGTGAWIPLQPVLGSGAAPSLVFSDNDTVHVVWVSNNQIRYASCELTLERASCNNSTTVQGNSQTKQVPDITIKSNILYIAWVNSSANKVEVARKPVSGGSWQLNSTSLDTNNTNFSGVVSLDLTADSDNSTNLLHLVYTYDDRTRLRYYRSTDGNTWQSQKDFEPALSASYQEVNNPTIVATGNDVYLAWDSLHNAISSDDGLKRYSLMGVLSTDGGASWESPRYITSNNAFTVNNFNDRRRSRNVAGANPAEEAGLRPTVAVDNEDKFAVVWQERPNASCDVNEDGSIITNGTSEVFLAPNADPNVSASSRWSSSSVVDAASVNSYSIDPDIVIDNTGDEHIVFMKSTADPDEVNCRAGGDLNSNTPHTYRIYYYGPYFTVIDPPTALLPIIVKN